MPIRFILTAILLLIPVSILAAPTGLVFIPTAQVLDEGVIDVQASAGTGDAQPNPSTGFEMGVGHGIEFGYDFGPSVGVNTYGASAKKILANYHKNSILAFGIQNVGHNLEAQPYLVGRVPIGQGWFHLGLIEIERITEPMVGYDISFANKWRLMADYTAGDEGAATFGAEVNIGSSSTFELAYARQNSGSDFSGIFVEVDWIFDVGGAKKD